MILKDIDLAMNFKNIMLDAVRLTQYFVKLSSTNIFLYHTQAIQFYISNRFVKNGC